VLLPWNVAVVDASGRRAEHPAAGDDMNHTSRSAPGVTSRVRFGGMLAVAVLLSGCGGSDGDPEPAAASSAQEPTTASPECAPGSDAANAADVVGVVETGQNTTDQLGTRLTWTSPELWDAGKSEPVTRTMVMLRGAGVLTTADADDEDPGELDVDLASLAQSAPDLEVSAPTDVTVGGAEARVVDVRSQQERPLFRAPTYTFAVHPDDVWRVWVVEQADQTPIVIFSNALRDDAEWLDETADEIVGSIELGEPVALDIAAATACRPFVGRDG
jgi:hypothetical protein